MQSLTDIQQAVYDYTRQALQHGLPFPSLRDIAGHFGFQHTTARFHLKALEKKGYIQQRSQRVSDYLLTNSGLAGEFPLAGHLAAGHPEYEAYAFDLVGRIPAGAPLPVFDETRESFSVTRDYFGGGEVLGIRVVGESMSGDAIADGDIAMIKRQQDANKGDILALRIEDEITLKRIRLDGDHFQLLPSNPEYSVRRVPAQQLEILGKLVGIVRKV
jgi:repressor LexA